MGWLSGWTYRKAITVSNGSADYQTKVLIGKTSAAVGEDVDCGGHIADDFDDLRFTAADETTLLDYWIEKIEDSGGTKLATVWVQNNATPDTTIYMYYGGTETAVSSGADTFIQYHGAASSAFHDANVSPTSGGFRYRARAKAATSSNILFGVANIGDISDDALVFQYYDSGSLRYVYTFNEGSNTAESENPEIADGTYYTVYALMLLGTNAKGYVEDGGGQIGSTITTNLPNEAMGLIMTVTGGSGDQLWSFISKYAATEPSFAFGSEETTGIPRHGFVNFQRPGIV